MNSRRARLAVTLGPALLLLGLGLLNLHNLPFFGGAALGWLLVAQFVLGSRVRMEYQMAIRHLRHSEYARAVAIMDSLVKAEPDDPNHRRFRAELHRLTGDLRRARLDYEALISLVPAQAEGYSGLAEVCVQQGDFQAARSHAQQAVAREPRRWITAYNLGMIEDRLGEAAPAVEHLELALAAGIPHSRERLLTRLWLARNHYRQDKSDEARWQLGLMRKEADGVQAWRVVLASEQAAPLCSLLEADVALARRLLDGKASLDDLGDEHG
jgi:tetratricopeptide (TPR) repeat protein